VAKILRKPIKNQTTEKVERSKTMSKRYYIYETAESVTMGHPDRASDYVADRLLDAYREKDADAHVAIEVMLSHEVLSVAGEVSGKHSEEVDSQSVAENTLIEIYNDTPDSFDADIFQQSPDIAQAVGSGEEQGAGDQGIVYGYATDETFKFLPLATLLARKITDRIDRYGSIGDLGPDGKAQVTIAKNPDGTFDHIATVVVSVQHRENCKLEQVQTKVRSLIAPIFEEYDLSQTEFLINPSGRFVVGGFTADTGLTGRKLMVDTYGGLAHHGGGAMGGKDPSKVDRSGALMARWVAVQIVGAGIASEAEVSIAYAIGKADPVAVDVRTNGKWETTPDRYIAEAVRQTFDFRPKAIEKALELQSVKWSATSRIGVFYGDDFKWNQIDNEKIAELKENVKAAVHEDAE
jgi:S-adenosylmethionine synthetase